MPLQSNALQNQGIGTGGGTSTSAIMTAAVAASTQAASLGLASNLTTSVESLKSSPTSSSASPPRFQESPPLFHHESKSSHSPLSQSMSPNWKKWKIRRNSKSVVHKKWDLFIFTQWYWNVKTQNQSCVFNSFSHFYKSSSKEKISVSLFMYHTFMPYHLVCQLYLFSTGNINCFRT